MRNGKKSPKKGPRFVAWFTTKAGKKIYASTYGYKGWPIGGSRK